MTESAPTSGSGDPAPLTFLIQSDPAKPATVSGDKTWDTIFKGSNFTTKADIPPTGLSLDADVTVEFGAWKLQFSSVDNETFLGSAPSKDKLLNHAWIGDDFNSAVLVLSSDQTFTKDIFDRDIQLSRGNDSAFKMLGITSSVNAQLTDFLKVVDSEDLPLLMRLQNPSKLKAQNPKLPVNPNPNPNALWCTTTADNYQTTVKLEYVVSITGTLEKSPIGQAITWANNHLGLHIDMGELEKAFGTSIPDLLVTTTKTKTYSIDDLTAVDTWTASFEFEIQNFKLALDFTDQNNAFYLLPKGSVTDLVNDLIVAVGSTDGLDRDQMPTVSSNSHFSTIVSDHLNVWYIKLEKGDSNLKWGVGFLSAWPKNVPALVGLTYDSNTKTFHGDLILRTDPVFSQVRYPDYDWRIALPHDTLLASQSINIDDIGPTLSLWKLFTGDSSPPPKELAHVPCFVSEADVTYQSFSDKADEKGSKVTFVMDLTASADPAAHDADVAPSGFTWEDISVMISKKAITNSTNKSVTKTTEFQIFSEVTLKPVHNKDIPPAVLDVTLAYKGTQTVPGDPAKSDWMLQGIMSDLSVALLADVFFNEDCSEGAMAVLGKLTLSELDIFYTYNSGEASSFLISAILKLGDLELDLSYQYISKKLEVDKPTAASLKWGSKPPHAEVSTLKPDAKSGPKNSWVFEAFLRVKDQSSTVASITESIIPGKGKDLPDFVGNIVIAAKGDPLNAPIKLIYRGNDTDGSILAVWVNIGSAFNMTFIQHRPPKGKSGDPLPKVKQIIRISVDQIPMLDKVPLVNQLPQPFDHLIYLWVDDPDQVNKNTQGFTREMIDKDVGAEKAINSALAEINIPEIQLKESKSKNAADLVLAAGHHFMVVVHNKVVLDHIFEPGPNPTNPAAKKQTPVVNTGVIHAAKTGSSPDPIVTTPESPPAKGDVNTTAGPLTISALTLQYKNGSLFVGVDATLVLGPLTFAVIGFTLEIKISKIQLNDLASLIKDGLEVSIHGLEAGVDKEPLTLKGVFIHDVVPDATGNVTTESYRGGIAVGFKAWKVLAVGEYAIVSTKNPASEFKSVFVYGKLDGPLVTLEFATISGVRLGFGYNSLVHLPSAEDLYKFPFISDTAAGDDPLAVLNAMEGGSPSFVYKKLGGVWFAAGMTITAFDCISLTAVLMFEIETKSDQNGVIIALLADGVFQMEPLAPPDLTLFYIELLIKVEINFIDGYIAADAALAPASHVYVPSARLTGSGSFYTWFPPSAHAGDWVVSIGGYHRAYNPPDHYPQNLKRLGLNFTVGNAVHVVGEGYVSVTPKVAMAGGSLHLSVEVGPVSAFADVALDVFINFKPFYFIAEIRLSVGVDCDVDLLFVSFHVSITLSADLTLWGPDSFGGNAYVDFWFFGFSIDFGSGLRDPPGIPLIDFYDMIRTAGPASDPPPGDKTSNSNLYQAQHKYSIEDGLFPDKPKAQNAGQFPNTGATTEWKVLAGPLQIRIDTDFSLSAAFIATTKGEVQIQPELQLNPIYAFPMHNTIPIKSEIHISVYALEGGEGAKELKDGFQAELVIKNAPKATWSKYVSDNDPLSRISGGKRNKPTSLQDGSEPTVELCQGVRIYPPVATLSKSPVIDFDATAAMFSSQRVEPLKPSLAQATLLADVFEADTDPVAQWKDFGDVMTGVKEGTVTTAGGVTFSKAEMRGDIGATTTLTAVTRTSAAAHGNTISAPVTNVAHDTVAAAGNATTSTPTTQPSTTIPAENTLKPTPVPPLTGMLSLLVSTLGWDKRRPVEMVAGQVPDVPIPDPNDSTKKIVQRHEWELMMDPPEILAGELGYYFPALPMVTSVA